VSSFVVLDAVTRVGDGGSAASPIPPVTNGAVDSLEDLALVEASRLTDGFLIFVRDEDAYYQIRIGEEDPGGINALNLADGQWLVAAMGGGGAAVLRAEWDDELVSSGGGEEDVADTKPRYENFDRLSGASITCALMCTAKVTAGEGTVRVRVGGTLGGVDGTVAAAGTVTAEAYPDAGQTFTGESFARPSGRTLVQVTLEHADEGERVYVMGAAVEFSAA
jgi:hypothetical protein